MNTLKVVFDGYFLLLIFSSINIVKLLIHSLFLFPIFFFKFANTSLQILPYISVFRIPLTSCGILHKLVLINLNCIWRFSYNMKIRSDFKIAYSIHFETEKVSVDFIEGRAVCQV